MTDATQPDGGDADWRDRTFDLTRGIAAYSGSGLVGGLARVVAKHPEANISNAFNHKQVACKMWARDRLFDSLGGMFRHASRSSAAGTACWRRCFSKIRASASGRIESIDIDPAVAVVAETLNRGANGRFRAVTADMYAIDYARLGADLVVNTSCEHIADLGHGSICCRRAPACCCSRTTISASRPTSAASNRSRPSQRLAGLAELRFSGTLPMKKYNRFMLIGRV